MNLYEKKKLASLISPVLTAFQVHRLFNPVYGGIGSILMLHRVLPPDNRPRIHNHHSLEISPEHLGNIIRFFRERNYDFISLDQLHNRLISKENSRKFVVFTMDDGYTDVYRYAWPLFKAQQVPFTLYVTTNFPDRKVVMWWYLLEDLLLQNERLTYLVREQETTLKCKTSIEKEEAFYMLRALLNKSTESDIVRFFENQGIDTSILPQYASPLTWDQIRTMSEDDLVTIGAHTISHPALNKLEPGQVIFEASESKRILESYIRKPVRHFCYPFGKPAEAGEREFELIKSLDFDTSTTTRQSNIFRAHRDHMNALPRISVNSMTTNKLLQLQVSGFLPALQNRFHRLVYR
jgi:peptidoglycan/xylan/chitin deacetylase (PgdA/CDA1 family)